MPTHDVYYTRNLSPLIRAWERELTRRGWHGSLYKMRAVAYRKAAKGQRP